MSDVDSRTRGASLAQRDRGDRIGGPPALAELPAWVGRVAWALLALAVAWLAAEAVDAYVFRNAALEAERHSRQAGRWYGSWGAAAFSVAFFSVFVLGFLRSPRPREWRHLGLSEAFLLALFAEMYGVPFTIYLLGSVTGSSFGLSMLEGHLWAVLLDRLGVLPLERGVGLVMAASLVLIIIGLALMTAGWYQTWRARRVGWLVTAGLYRWVRHPQYLGFLLLALGFLVQWPTLPTLSLFPLLALAYVRLARREERDLATLHDEAWAAYRSRTPLLVPGWPTRTGSGPTAAGEERPDAVHHRTGAVAEERGV